VKLQRLLEISAALLVLVALVPARLLGWGARARSGTALSGGGGTGVLPVALAGALGVCVAWGALESLFTAPTVTVETSTAAPDVSYRIHEARPRTPELSEAR
jgi:hypothetical protein